MNLMFVFFIPREKNQYLHAIIFINAVYSVFIIFQVNQCTLVTGDTIMIYVKVPIHFILSVFHYLTFHVIKYHIISSWSVVPIHSIIVLYIFLYIKSYAPHYNIVYILCINTIYTLYIQSNPFNMNIYISHNCNL